MERRLTILVSLLLLFMLFVGCVAQQNVDEGYRKIERQLTSLYELYSKSVGGLTKQHEMNWEQNFRTDGRFQGSDGFRGNFMQENPRMHGHNMSPVQGQFRHPKPYFDSPRLPFQRSGFQNPQNYQHSFIRSENFNRPPYQPRPTMSGFYYQQPRNSNSFDRQWKHPKSRSQVSVFCKIVYIQLILMFV